MKSLVTLSFLFLSLAAISQKTTTATVAKAPAVAAATTTPATAKFATLKHSFGNDVKQNKPATYTFTFVNTGKKPLVVESAVAGCGCTTPVYTKAPIAKGKKGDIKVTYNAAALGTFTKTVTVKFLNIAEPVILTIDGEVKA